MSNKKLLKLAAGLAIFLTPISGLNAQDNFVTPQISDFLPEKITVFVDFNSPLSDETIVVNNLVNPREVYGTYVSIPYTASDKQEIIRRLEEDYKSFGVNFTLEEPESGVFEKLIINNLPPRSIFYNPDTQAASVRYGTIFSASSIDTLNRDDGETATASGEFWDFLAQEDPSGDLFRRISGMEITTTLEDAVAQAKINTLANIGAHEVGHLLGLSHHDSFSPVGSGLDPLPSAAENDDFFPPYTGPRNANLTVLQLMSTGSNPSVVGQINQTFSDRSLLKLAAIRGLSQTMETESSTEGQQIILQPVTLPGRRSVIRNPDIVLMQRAANIKGSLDELEEEDFYTFTAEAGEFVTVETFGRRVINRAAEVAITIFYQSEQGELIQIDTNDLNFEGRDALLLDVPLPATGTYVLKINSANASRTLSGIFRSSVLNFFKIGEYEALIYSSRRIDPSS